MARQGHWEWDEDRQRWRGGEREEERHGMGGDPWRERGRMEEDRRSEWRGARGWDPSGARRDTGWGGAERGTYERGSGMRDRWTGEGEQGTWDRGAGMREREWAPREREHRSGRGSEYEMEDRWRGERSYGGGARPEIDPPWVEQGPRARSRGDTRGLVEWEDRGPIEWLADRFRGEDRRPRGPKGYKRSDDRIHEDVCERIARSGIDADEVEVKVANGEVTLTGTVPSRADKWRLETVADDAFGVVEVHNQLRVTRAHPGAAHEPGGGLRH